MGSTQVGVRLDDELVEKIDALAERLSTSWRKVTRADVLRGAEEEGLPILAKLAEAQDGVLGTRNPSS